MKKVLTLFLTIVTVFLMAIPTFAIDAQLNFDDHCYCKVDGSWKLSQSYDKKPSLTGGTYNSGVIVTCDMGNGEKLEILTAPMGNYSKRYDAERKRLESTYSKVEYTNENEWAGGVYIPHKSVSDVVAGYAYLLGGSYYDAGIKHYFAYGYAENPHNDIYYVSMDSENIDPYPYVEAVLKSFHWDYKYDWQLED